MGRSSKLPFGEIILANFIEEDVINFIATRAPLKFPALLNKYAMRLFPSDYFTEQSENHKRGPTRYKVKHEKNHGRD